jgi:imidazolonepropionase-like amidohydrolase
METMVAPETALFSIVRRDNLVMGSHPERLRSPPAKIAPGEVLAANLTIFRRQSLAIFLLSPNGQRPIVGPLFLTRISLTAAASQEDLDFFSPHAIVGVPAFRPETCGEITGEQMARGWRRVGMTGLLCANFFVMSPTFGQVQETSSKTYVLKAARMFDGKSDALARPGIVVVTDGKIVGVGAGAAIPTGAEVIDFGDATLLPGFIDAHTHLTMMYAGDDSKQASLDVLQKTIAERALDASANARVTLMAGITTVRDVGSSDYLDVGLRNAIRDRVVPGPRMLVTVHALSATGGHCDHEAGFRAGLFGHESGPLEGVINGPEQARYAVRLDHKYGADMIKVCATGGVLSPTDDVDTPQLTQAELDAIVDEAHALRRKTAAHAHGAEGAKRAIRAGIDSIEHGTFLDDEALDMMKHKGTFLVPTLMAPHGVQERIDRGLYIPPAILAKAKAAIAAHDQTVRKALAKGVKIGLGTDAGVYPHGRNVEEFHLLVDVGMKPIDALKAGTSADADLLGLADKIGTLEAGKLADIVAVPGDPVENIRQTEHVFFVMKEGVIYKNDRGTTAH